MDNIENTFVIAIQYDVVVKLLLSSYTVYEMPESYCTRWRKKYGQCVFRPT